MERKRLREWEREKKKEGERKHPLEAIDHNLTKYVLFASLLNIHSYPLKYVHSPFCLDEEAEVRREGKVPRNVPEITYLFWASVSMGTQADTESHFYIVQCSPSKITNEDRGVKINHFPFNCVYHLCLGTTMESSSISWPKTL